jgi:diacylglycerol O-acyltransferase-1
MTESKQSKTLKHGDPNKIDAKSIAELRYSSRHETEIRNDTTIEKRKMEAINSLQIARVSHFPHEPKPRPSILTTTEHQGFLNLAGILIIGWCVIQMHHTYNQTGKYIDFELLFLLLHDFPMMLVLWASILVFACTMSVLLEYIYTRFEKARKGWKDKLLILIYVICIVLMFTVPPYISLLRDMSPLLRGALAMQVCVSVMKFHSYFMTNRYLRQIYESKKEIVPKRSIWILLKDYVTFITFPTLVYETNFPRNNRIDFGYVIKEVTGALICFLCMYLVLQQYLIPYLELLDEIPLYEYIYLLGVPTLFLWVIGFYGVFHCMFNAIAEVTRFQDREFYLAWWDSTSMSEFWRLWNRPVYKFMCRHIYVESMRAVPFFNKYWAAISTYVVTAIFHEYVLVIAFGFLRPYFFTIICAQIPFVFFTDKYLKGTRAGNIAMWVGFVLGFPVLQLSYCYSYLNRASK